MNVVLYHDSCTDGFAAALLMRKYFQTLGLPCELKGVNYHHKLPEGIEEKNVYIVDFSYSPEKIRLIAAKARSVVMLDHHQTAAKMYEGYGDKIIQAAGELIDIRIHEHQSGVGMVYDYLLHLDNLTDMNLQFLHNERLKKFVAAVQDYDLWKFELDDTRVYNEMLQMMPRVFDEWDKVIFQESEEDYARRYEKAFHYFEVKDSLAKQYAARHKITSFCGYRVPMANAPHAFAPAVGDYLNRKHFFSLTFDVYPDRVHCSLRSNKRSRTDVAVIAEMFGGGGHKNSSAFDITHKQLPLLLAGKFKVPWSLRRFVNNLVKKTRRFFK